MIAINQQQTTTTTKRRTDYGQNREMSDEELRSADVIITSYNVVEYEYRAETIGLQRKSGKVFKDSFLHAVSFFRVVLDEAHHIKVCPQTLSVCGCASVWSNHG